MKINKCISAGKHTYTNTHSETHTSACIHMNIGMFVDYLCNFAVPFVVCFVTLQLITLTVYACVARQETFGVATDFLIPNLFCFCFFFSMVHKKLMRKRLLLSCGTHACTHGTHGTHCTRHLFALRACQLDSFSLRHASLLFFLRPFPAVPFVQVQHSGTRVNWIFVHNYLHMCMYLVH